ncbi:MAG: hypothetical protein PHW09_12310 [Desulfovibrio desulfuricans]|nr:hypothetical protein [Desulfovibrio desulfuricans]
MKVTTSQKQFIEGRHPSKLFMPALEVKTSTLHAWNDRGYMSFSKNGSGKSLFLSGPEVIQARCLFILKTSGCAPRVLGSRGLYDGIIAFTNACINAYEECISIEKMFLVYRITPFISGIDTGYYDTEWELKSEKDIFGPHITEAHGTKPYSFWCVLGLSEILKDMTKRIM